MYVAGPPHAVPRKAGDNRLGWPIRLGTTSSWDDTITGPLDGASAFYAQGVLFRFWTIGPGLARRLLGLVEAMISEDYEPARKSWWDMGPEFSLEFFEFQISSLASASQIDVMDDEGLISRLREIDRQRYDREKRRAQSAQIARTPC